MENTNAKVKDNIIDYPELRCNIKNKTGKDIIAYELYFVRKDVYDEEVNSIFTSKKLGGNDMLKANKSRDVKWSILDREVKKGDLYVYSVTFDDGSSWRDKDIYSKKIKEYGVQIPVSFVKRGGNNGKQRTKECFEQVAQNTMWT